MQEPHIKRFSLWNHAEFAVSKLIWFGGDDRQNYEVPALVHVFDIPKLVIFAIQNITTPVEAAQTLEREQTGQAIETLTKKVRLSIVGGVLPIYDPAAFLRIDLSQIPVNVSDCLVRVDDLASWLRTEGIEIGHVITTDTNTDSPTNGHVQTEESKGLNKDVDPLDLPEELDAANMAFRAVLNGYGEQTATFKNRLIEYLKANYSHLKTEAIDRIATVANPDKARGRKTRDTK